MRLPALGVITDARSNRDAREQGRNALAAGILVAAFALCYARVVASLVAQWWSNTIYLHGFLIPVISAYLVWIQRERIMRVRPEPSGLAGTTLLLLGLAALLIGHAGAVIVVQEASLIVTLAGLVLLVLGQTWLRLLFLPLAYLVFMIPAWGVLTSGLHGPLQHFSAAGAVMLLRAIGTPVAREGTFIRLPTMTLEVAKICSGVNYLIAVAAIGIPLAALSFRDWRRRVLLVGVGLLIAILSNPVRIALIGMLAYLGFTGPVHGPFHLLQGMFVAFVGFAALFAAASALRGNPTSDQAFDVQPPASSPGRMEPWRPPVRPILWASSLLLVTGSLIILHNPRPVVLARDLNKIPIAVGEWIGRDTAPDSAMQATLRPDQFLSRVYTRVDGPAIRIYVAYHSYQIQGKELVNDGTAVLHQGAVRHLVVAVPMRRDPLAVRWQIQQGGAREALVLFWYNVGGQPTDNRFAAQALTAWGALARGESEGALIVMGCDIPEGESASATLRRADELLRLLYPELEICISRR